MASTDVQPVSSSATSFMSEIRADVSVAITASPMLWSVTANRSRSRDTAAARSCCRRCALRRPATASAMVRNERSRTNVSQ